MKYQRTVTVTAGNSEVIVLPKDLDTLPISLQLVPGSGGTLTAQASCSDIDTISQTPASALWSDLTPASTTASLIIQIDTPISAIKITAATATGTVNLAAFHKSKF